LRCRERKRTKNPSRWGVLSLLEECGARGYYASRAIDRQTTLVSILRDESPVILG
jgi:hypothetical protein